MMLKIIILVEFIALLLCLGSGFTFLLKDIGIPGSKRTLYALGARITIAVLLMGTIAYGIQTGQIRNAAPWDRPVTASPESEVSS